MGMIKAIETVYKGYRFRSRLEARWAVFFDALEIQWEYEPEGFDLGKDGYYLPDFWLPTFGGGMYAEVKPIGGDFTKALRFCESTQQDIWLCEGSPDFRVYTVAHPQTDNDKEIGSYVGIPNADQAQGENRMFALPGYEEEDGTISHQYLGCLGSFYINAVNKARSARFEHGETP